jgi:hypothetical protein
VKTPPASLFIPRKTAQNRDFHLALAVPLLRAIFSAMQRSCASFMAMNDFELL